jgi:hypothetical protein
MSSWQSWELGSQLQNRDRERKERSGLEACGCAGWVGGIPLRAAALFPQGIVAPQSKVLTFSIVAPYREGKWLAALPLRVLQRAPSLSPFCHHGELSGWKNGHFRTLKSVTTNWWRGCCEVAHPLGFEPKTF